MDALLMCGGRGTRLATEREKPLVRVGGRAMVDRVADALAAAERVDAVHAVVSPGAPATRDHLDGRLPLVETPGEGYVADLRRALATVGTPALTVAADLPLLDGAAVDAVLRARERRDADSLSVLVPVARKRALGLSVDADRAFTPPERERDHLPAGINVAGADSDTMHTTDDTRLAVNVNRRRDLRVAEALL